MEFWGVKESRKISRHLQLEKIKARTRNEVSVRPSSRMKPKDSYIFRFIFTLRYSDFSSKANPSSITNLRYTSAFQRG